MAANPGRLGAAFSRFLGVTGTLPSKVISFRMYKHGVDSGARAGKWFCLLSPLRRDA